MIKIEKKVEKMPDLPQGIDRAGSHIKVGVDGLLSPQILVACKGSSRLETQSVISPDFRRKLSDEYDPLRDQFFQEMLVLCDEVFYPIKKNFLVKIWKKPFKDYYKVDGIRGIITIDIPITSFYGRMRYSRIVIIPRGFILDSKELQALWMAAFSIEKPRDGDLDSMTVAVFTLKAGERLPTYRFERLGRRSKAEFMTFVGLPAKSMAKFLEILIPFLEKKLKGFLKRFEIPLHYVAYSLGSRAFYVRSYNSETTKQPDLRTFRKYWPDVVDYLKNVKSGWLRNALKGLMTIINQLVDAYLRKIKPQKKSELKIFQAIRRETQTLRRRRLKPRPIEIRIKRMTEIALFYQAIDIRKTDSIPSSNLKPPNAPLKLSESKKSYRRASEAINK